MGGSNDFGCTPIMNERLAKILECKDCRKLKTQIELYREYILLISGPIPPHMTDLILRAKELRKILGISNG